MCASCIQTFNLAKKWGEVRWGELVLNAIFQPCFGYIWRSVSTAGGTNCSWEWTSNLPLVTDNYLSWDSNPSGEGRVVSKRDTLTTRPRRPLAKKNLECKNCKRKLCSLGGAIVNQPDIGHRQFFPVLLTYQYACDNRTSEWLNSCSSVALETVQPNFKRGMAQQVVDLCDWMQVYSQCWLMTSARFPNSPPPPQIPVPKFKWLMHVYSDDVMRRVEEVKGSVTSIYGKVLKLDSTKKIVRKLFIKTFSDVVVCM